MKTPAEHFWKPRLKRCKNALNANNFEAFLADDPMHAREIVLQEILPKIKPETVSWGDSMTLYSTGILDDLKKEPGNHVIETFDDTVARAEIIERRRQALRVDLFLPEQTPSPKPERW